MVYTVQYTWTLFSTKFCNIVSTKRASFCTHGCLTGIRTYGFILNSFWSFKVCVFHGSKKKWWFVVWLFFGMCSMNISLCPVCRYFFACTSWSVYQQEPRQDCNIFFSKKAIIMLPVNWRWQQSDLIVAKLNHKPVTSSLNSTDMSLKNNCCR